MKYLLIQIVIIIKHYYHLNNYLQVHVNVKWVTNKLKIACEIGAPILGNVRCIDNIQHGHDITIGTLYMLPHKYYVEMMHSKDSDMDIRSDRNENIIYII